MDRPQLRTRPNAPKFHQDRSHYQPALQRWFSARRPEAGDVRVGGIDIPAATGFSNETVFFDVDWTEGGDRPTTNGSSPASSRRPARCSRPRPRPAGSRSASSTGRWSSPAHHGVPMCPLVGFEADPSVLGQPFFVMGFVEGCDSRRRAAVLRGRVPGRRGDARASAQRMVRHRARGDGPVHAIDWRTAGLEWLDASGDGHPTQAVQLRALPRLRDREARRTRPSGDVRRARLAGGQRSPRRAHRADRGATPGSATSSGGTTSRRWCATGKRARWARPRPISAGG